MTETTPLPKGWHAKRLRQAVAAPRELMRWSLYLNECRTIGERITGEFRWKSQ
jgi:hypothetical protein